MSLFSFAGLLLLVLATPLPAADLQVGVAKTNITPPLGGSMYGYGARGSNVSAGVHDPLFAKTIVLSDGTKKLAIVTLDLGSMPRKIPPTSVSWCKIRLISALYCWSLPTLTPHLAWRLIFRPISHPT